MHSGSYKCLKPRKEKRFAIYTKSYDRATGLCSKDASRRAGVTSHRLRRYTKENVVCSAASYMELATPTKPPRSLTRPANSPRSHLEQGGGVPLPHLKRRVGLGVNTNQDSSTQDISSRIQTVERIHKQQTPGVKIKLEGWHLVSRCRPGRLRCSCAPSTTSSNPTTATARDTLGATTNAVTAYLRSDFSRSFGLSMALCRRWRRRVLIGSHTSAELEKSAT